jgi:hypothetical protein
VEENIENRGLLKRVFRLKYLENVTNGLELSEKLDLSFAETVELEQILDAYLLKKINVINAERLELVCPECLEARVWPDPESGERACTNCGFVVNEPADNELCEQDDSLPFDTPYGRPTSDLSVGRSLGDTLDAKSQGLILEDNCHVKSLGLADFQISTPCLAERLISGESYVFDDVCAYRLRTNRKGVRIVDSVSMKDFRTVANAAFDTLQLRVQKTRSITNQETRGLDGLLKMAFDLSKRCGLGTKSESKFNNSLGANVRRAFRLNQDYHLVVPKRGLVETMFYLTLIQFGKKSVAPSGIPGIYPGLYVPIDYLRTKNLLEVDESFLIAVCQLKKLIDRLMSKSAKSSLKVQNIPPLLASSLNKLL